MNRIKTIIGGAITLVVLLFAAYELFRWTVMRVYVDQGHALVVINKFGSPLPPDRVVVPVGDNSYKGVQEQVLGPGRYFLDPVEYDWKEVDLKQIPAGDPAKWDWDHNGNLKDADTAPMVGIVSLKEGKTPPAGLEVAPPPGSDGIPYKGVQREVLTPGTYKYNPYQREITIVPAVVVPPGSVGVRTNLVNDVGMITSTPLADATATAADDLRLASGNTHRGILPEVLQPGIYYLNPRMVKVTIVPVGYDQITLDHTTNKAIRFYSKDGYQVEADLTVVWGRTPADAPHIVATIGDTQKVEANLIEPAVKAACQNEGSDYTAKELIQGETRSKFQDALSQSLDDQVSGRHVHVLLALVRSISIKDSGGNDQTGGLLASIQQANIEVERNLTNQEKTKTAVVAASLQQSQKLVDVARETVAAETNVKVAGTLADGQKKAAEIDAQRELSVAEIQAQVAQLDAQRTEILGKANADVTRMKSDADAKGAKMLVDAFGSPQAYNLYTFAKNFQPDELRLIFAGPGTFWTDLKNFQDVGATKILQQSSQSPPGAAK